MKPLRELFEMYRLHKLQFASDSTCYQYRLNLQRFEAFIGREGTTDDLTDVQIMGAMAYVVRTLGLSISSANKLKDDFCAVWRWAARKQIVSHWPDVVDIPEPKRVPIAWSREQLTTLWDCCSRQPGEFCGVPAGLWWNTLHAVAFDTAERIGALFQTEWTQIDLESRWIIIRAEMRKGRREDKLSRLHPTTCAMLKLIGFPERDRTWPWPFHKSYLWKRYTAMLKRASLPHDRAHKFHCLRKSVASYFEAAGGDATQLLGHASRETTMKYLDQTIIQQKQASDLLFRPDEQEPPKAA